jgi:hypothetical protein
MYASGSAPAGLGATWTLATLPSESIRREPRDAVDHHHVLRADEAGSMEEERGLRRKWWVNACGSNNT